MAFRFRDAETRPVTRELASRFQSMREVESERRKKPQRLAQLSQLLQQGAVKCFEWAVAHLGGEEIRVNGNHTSYLLANPENPIPEGATAVIQHYECETMGDVVSLWGMFDATLSGRTKAEKLITYARSVPGLEDLGSECLSLVQSALILEADGTCQTKMTGDQRNALVAANIPFARWYAGLWKFDTKSVYRKKVGVCYAALQMWRKAPERAGEFWREVATGANPNPQSGSRHLREYMLTKHKRMSKGNRRGADRMWEDMAKASLHCWNLWRRGDSVRYIRSIAEIPQAI